MNSNTRRVVAMTAATLFLSVPFSASASEAAAGHCAGVNECKGQSACKSGSHECKGQNECKGQGIVEATEADCTAKGGTFTAAAAE
jgi:hypothetical protein